MDVAVIDEEEVEALLDLELLLDGLTEGVGPRPGGTLNAPGRNEIERPADWFPLSMSAHLAGSNMLDWLKAGTHVSSVGYRPPVGEMPQDVLDAGRLFVETRLAFAPAELVGAAAKRTGVGLRVPLTLGRPHG